MTQYDYHAGQAFRLMLEMSEHKDAETAAREKGDLAEASIAYGKYKAARNRCKFHAEAAEALSK